MTTVFSILDKIPTEAAAYEYLEQLRWGNEPTCAHCGSADVALMVPANGTSRKTRTGAMSERRVWQCRACRKQFSVTTGTVMHGTKVPIRTWVLVFFEMCSSKHGVPAREIERKYGLCPRTAWHLLHRIRAAMDTDTGLLGGVVEADEMYTGVRRKGKHASMAGKVAVVTVVERGGRAKSKVAAHQVQASSIVAAAVEPGTAVVTDESRLYTDLGQYVAKHATVNHGRREWVRGEWTTNTVEGFFGQVRRSISGTHHRVTNKHVGRYMDEFDFRYSTRKVSDAERMATLLRQVDGPLPYAALTGRV